MTITKSLMTHVRDLDTEMSESDRRSLCARVFGELIWLAKPIIESYHSDLYYDALWVNKNVGGECVFYFGVDGYGTAIDADKEWCGILRQNVYRIEVRLERYTWVLDITPVVIAN